MKKRLTAILCTLLALVLLICACVPLSAVAEDGVEPQQEQGEVINDGWNEDKTQYYENSEPVKSTFKDIDGKKYYFSERGVMQTGFKKIGISKYRFHLRKGYAITGFRKIDGYYYLFHKSGKMTTGWQKVNGKYRYFYNKGKKYGRAATGLVKIKGYRYYFTKTGKVQTGWKKIDGDYYYFNKSKKKLGRAVTGIVTIDGVKYKFKKNGKYVGEVNEMDEMADDYSSPTSYLIIVSRSKHKVAIYKGKKGSWDRIKYYDCTVGAPATKTPAGNFLIGPSGGKPFHQRYFDSGAVRCWYATRIVGGYNFHSVLYTQYPTPKYISNGTLGADLSHGCVRLQIDNAKWIYDNIPQSTRCVIY